MAKTWLVVDDVTSVVVGHTRSGKATAVPAAPAGRRHVDVTDAKQQEFAAAQRVLRGAGRPTTDLTEVAGEPVVLDDARPYVEFTSSAAELEADGVDSVTVTITSMNADGSVKTSLNADRKISLDLGPLGLRRVKLTFTAGVATKVVKAQEGQSGEVRIVSTPAFRVKDEPFVLDVVESS